MTTKRTNQPPVPAPAYVVTNEARGIPRYVGTDAATALTWAQAAADADLAKRPNDTTPHYVVTPWFGDKESDNDAVHVYGGAELKATADAMARATGAVSVTVVEERREADGTLTETGRATSGDPRPTDSELPGMAVRRVDAYYTREWHRPITPRPFRDSQPGAIHTWCGNGFHANVALEWLPVASVAKAVRCPLCWTRAAS